MKKIVLSLALAAMALGAYALDSLNRTTETVVKDVLAVVPCCDSAAFYTEFGSLAACAPESVTMLATMLQQGDTTVRSRIEYALSGLAIYASGSRGEVYRKAVTKGFKEALASSDDTVVGIFLEMQLRIADPSSSSPLRLAPDYTRAKAPKFSLKKYNEMTDSGKADILYWIGESRDTSRLDFIIGQMSSSSPEVAQSAAVAASKIGTDRAVAALLEMFGATAPDIPDNASDVPEKVVYDANGNKISNP